MKKLIFYFAAFAAIVSCTKEPVGGDFGQDEAQVITFKAVAAKSSKASADTDTKTVLVDHSLVHWSNADQVKVGFFPVTGSSKNNIKNKNGIFKATFDEEAASTAWFSKDDWKWDAGNSENASHYRTDGLAVYPATATVSSSRNGSYSPATTEVSYDLPSEQTAVLNSFQSGVNFSYAKVNKDQFSANKATLSFMNGCSLLKLTLPASAENVAMVKVTSNNGVAMTGKFSLGYDELGGYYQDQPWSKATTEGVLKFTAVSGNSSVVLKADEGKSLQAGGTYYIVVWPGTHGSGLSFEFTSTDGATCVKSVDQNVAFERAVVERFNFTSDIPFVKEPHLEVNMTSLSFGATSSSATFTVLANYDWSVSDNASWLSVSPAFGAASLSESIVTVTAETNTDYMSSRSAIITVAAEGLTHEIIVTQEAAAKPKFVVGNSISDASKLKDGGKYVLRAVRGNGSGGIYTTYYFWKVDSDGKLIHENRYSDTWGDRDFEHVFEYKKTGEDGVTDSNYKAKSAGYWKSLATGKYMSNDFVFDASVEGSAQKMAMANKWGTETSEGIDFYKHGTTTPMSTGGEVTNNFVWGGLGDTYRKWVIYEVTQR